MNWRDLSRAVASLAKWGNDLIEAYRTIAQTVGVAELDIHLLMNHSVVGVKRRVHQSE